MSKANIYNMLSGLKSFVLAYLPAQLRLIEAEIGGGLKLTDPADHVIGYRDPFNARELPIICYVATEGTAEAESAHACWYEPEIDILLAIKHSKPEKLEEYLLYYSDALINLFGTDEGIGATCDTSEITRIQWFHGAPGDQSVAIFLLTLLMRKEVQT